MPKWIFPFSHAWHDDMDLDGHVEMTYNADGMGPEMDSEKVKYIQCWCWRGADCPIIEAKELDCEED